MKPEDLNQEAQKILVKALESHKGNIRSIETVENQTILIDGNRLGDGNDDRYFKAFNKLIRSRLIKRKQMDGNIYQLTEAGYKIAKEIQ
ncbi:MAG: hypothetical protein ACOC4G_11225 [Bacillota bacterium]